MPIFICYFSLFLAPLSCLLCHTWHPEAPEKAYGSGTVFPPAALCPCSSCPWELLCVVPAVTSISCCSWVPGFGKPYVGSVSEVIAKTLIQILTANMKPSGNQTPICTRLHSLCSPRSATAYVNQCELLFGLQKMQSDCPGSWHWPHWRSWSVLSSGNQTSPSITFSSPVSKTVPSGCKRTPPCYCCAGVFCILQLGRELCFRSDDNRCVCVLLTGLWVDSPIK